MWQQKYAEAAHHFSIAAQYCPEVLKLQKVCEFKAEVDVGYSR
jgi:hypothetical protein